MRNYGLPVFFLVVLAIAIMLACGSPASRIDPSCSAAPTATNPSMPQSITVCPAVADAQDYPNGQVQFVAIGTFQTAPSPALAKAEVWGVCQNDAATTAVAISSSGVAQCEPGSTGTYSVYGSDWTTCEHVGPCGTGCMVTGYAKLTCP